MEPRFSDPTQSIYTGNCEILHVNDNNCGVLETIKSENCIMSTLSSSLESELRPRGLALKFTAEGLETYWFHNKPYKVCGGKYLLVNESVPSMEVVIKNVTTWGMCVDLNMQLVNEVLHQVLCPDDLEGYRQVNRYLLSPELFVRETIASARMQQLLNELIMVSLSPAIQKPAMELIYDLISLLVEDNLAFIFAYYRLRLSKLSTRKELYHRLLIGKEMLDDSVFSDIGIKEVADVCCLSEFRFYKLFKECFQVSPYHYLVRRRIETSLELSKKGMSWSEVACLLNFSDLAAFSNAFKKITGVAPTKYNR
ncbi:AraC family transcriptional regulator [uncultured Pontibacter sp.]|uniref:helix-turn-helix domain-containing protein n=1 Tax=uncultured Pontibacter sp. TaxID=453356 RepID=UPI002635FE38|nr:AraC family transcriptional regulator [uncultured Pontibacter sp.]